MSADKIIVAAGATSAGAEVYTNKLSSITNANHLSGRKTCSRFIIQSFGFPGAAGPTVVTA